MNDDAPTTRDQIREMLRMYGDGIRADLVDMLTEHHRQLANLEYDLDRIDRGNHWLKEWQKPSGTSLGDPAALPLVLQAALWHAAAPFTDILATRFVSEALAEAVRRAAAGDGALLAEIGAVLVPRRFRAVRSQGRHPKPAPSTVSRENRLVRNFHHTKNQIAAVNRLLPKSAKTLAEMRWALSAGDWIRRLEALPPNLADSISLVPELLATGSPEAPALALRFLASKLPAVRRIRLKQATLHTAALQLWKSANRLQPGAEAAELLKGLRDRDRKRNNSRQLVRPRTVS